MSLFVECTDGSYRCRTASILGQVTIGRQSSFWFNVVVRGDVAPIVIGQRVNVQDNSTIHCDSGHTNYIEDDVSIGHNAVVHGKRVGRGSLIGMHSTLLGGSIIGEQCIIAAGAVVPPGMSVPDRHLAAGVPARVVRPLTEEDLRYIGWIPGHYINLARKYISGEWAEAK